MSPYLTRVKQVALRRLGPLPLVKLAATGFLAVASLIFQDFLSERALPYFWGGIKTLLGLPVGLFGLLFLGLVLAELLAAFVDTSPTAETLRGWLASRDKKTEEAVSPVILPDSELRAIDNVRVFWRDSASDAVKWLLVVLFQIRNDLPAKNVFVVLLRYPVDRLETARNEILGALQDTSQVPLDQVRARVDLLFQSYMEAVRWLHACENVDADVFKKAPHHDDYRRWRKRHDEMVGEFGRLTKRAHLSGLEWTLDNIIRDKERLEPRTGGT